MTASNILSLQKEPAKQWMVQETTIVGRPHQKYLFSNTNGDACIPDPDPLDVLHLFCSRRPEEVTHEDSSMYLTLIPLQRLSKDKYNNLVLQVPKGNKHPWYPIEKCGWTSRH